MTLTRNITPLDRLLIRLDEALRLSTGAAPDVARANPATGLQEGELDAVERRHAAGLMRVNHAGEICAQALYAGQAATARQDKVRKVMQQAADEEIDHLSWCETRLRQLDDRTSLLNPFWYAGSFAIGALAGLAGDKTSLGFVAETEKQVGAHLAAHLNELPAGDARTRSILEQMGADEARHGQNATKAGANELPPPIRALMQLTSKVMTRTAYWL